MFFKKARLRNPLRKRFRKVLKQNSKEDISLTKTEMTDRCENYGNLYHARESSQDMPIQSVMSRGHSFDNQSASSHSALIASRSKPEPRKLQNKMVNEDEDASRENGYLVIRQHQLYPDLPTQAKADPLSPRKSVKNVDGYELQDNFLVVKEHKLSESALDINFNWVNEIPEVLIDEGNSDNDSLGSLEMLMEQVWSTGDEEEVSLPENSIDQQLQTQSTGSRIITAMNSFCHG